MGSTMQFHGLGWLGATNHDSDAAAVSGDGSVVVGVSQDDAGNAVAFRWTQADGMQPLGLLPGGHHSQAYAVSANGNVIAGYANNNVAFRWTSSSGLQSLGTPLGGSGSFAQDMNSLGNVIVGYGTISASGLNEAQKWTITGGWQGLGHLPGGAYQSIAWKINGAGTVIAGESGSAAGLRAVRWVNGQIQDLGPGRATGVDALGDTIVGTDFATGHAFRWTPTTGMTDLIEPPGNFSTPSDVSADGNIVVGYTTGATTSPDGFVWDAQHGMRSLESMLIADGVDVAGWQIRYIEGISFDGSTVVGQGINPAGDQEAFVATLPEPGTSALVLLGAAACFPARRRRR
jgi:probable HAF family extracellular repeat protein